MQAGSLRSPGQRCSALVGFAALLIGMLALAGISSAEKLLAPATIVVFNKDVPESVELAKFYAQKRGIDRDHLVGLTCSKAEEITRDEYDVTIRDPLRAIFDQRKWWARA